MAVEDLSGEYYQNLSFSSEVCVHRPNYNELDGGTEDVSQSDRDEAETRAVTLTEPLRKSERNVH